MADTSANNQHAALAAARKELAQLTYERDALARWLLDIGHGESKGTSGRRSFSIRQCLILGLRYPFPDPPKHDPADARKRLDAYVPPTDDAAVTFPAGGGGDDFVGKVVAP